MRRLIVGDIHGQYDLLIETLKSAGFNPDEDVLYGLGDFCDRGERNLDVLRYLMSLGDNFKSVFGNHDIWIWQYLHEGIKTTKKEFSIDFASWIDKPCTIPYMTPDVESCWVWNGGETTESELYHLDEDEGKRIFDWIGKLPYKIELDKYTIVHTPSLKPVMGKNIDQTTLTLTETMEKNLCEKDYDSWFWDRDIISMSNVFSKRGLKIIPDSVKNTFGSDHKTYIIGHTPITEGPLYDSELNMITLDTGAFVRKERFNIEGKMTVMDLDTLEYWQTDGDFNKFNGKIELV